jgi:mannose-1-phosphate guanylyltransferase
VLPTDDDGNAVLGEALSIDAGENVVATDDKHVSLVGVEDLAVVAFDDRVLVVPTSEAQRVREVVERLRPDDEF